jgi:hypothetical protein
MRFIPYNVYSQLRAHSITLLEWPRLERLAGNGSEYGQSQAIAERLTGAASRPLEGELHVVTSA